jgi:hypothetical protein
MSIGHPRHFFDCIVHTDIIDSLGTTDALTRAVFRRHRITAPMIAVAAAANCKDGDMMTVYLIIIFWYIASGCNKK